MQEYFDETCTVTCDSNGKSVIAETLSFQKEKFISVSIERSIKLNLNWNGTTYRGNMGNLSFTTPGPNCRTANSKGRNQ